jgi:DNA ligase 1
MRCWAELSLWERFVFNKLVTGQFRVGVSQGLVVRALSEASGVEATVIAHRLMGQWEPSSDFFRLLLSTEDSETQISRPYPFCLAHPLQQEPESLGDIGDWLLEWKWDGIRAQIIRRRDKTFLWSRGEELLVGRFPEIEGEAEKLPNGTVLDGEIVGWRNGRPLPFGELQRRINRKTVSKKLLDDVPVQFIAFDQLEQGGEDIREQPLDQRRASLAQTIVQVEAPRHLRVSQLVSIPDWETCRQLRSSSREQGVEGFMLKRRDSPYGVGRVTGLWWKWKVDPFSCDAVLVYAQRGSGRRASLYTDYTFGVWSDGELIPFAKAYSGLTDAEIHEVDRFVRQNTLERFGPVRVVKPELVFELAFEAIQPSKRHKSGVAVRFPRIARWRKDKLPQDADTLAMLRGLLPPDPVA